MEQFNVISEGSRAAGRGRVMREGCPAPLSGARVGAESGVHCRLWGREVGETARCRPLGLRAEPGEGDGRRGKVPAFKSPAAVGGGVLFYPTHSTAFQVQGSRGSVPRQHSS